MGNCCVDRDRSEVYSLNYKDLIYTKPQQRSQKNQQEEQQNEKEIRVAIQTVDNIIAAGQPW